MGSTKQEPDAELNYDVPEWAINRTSKRAVTMHMRQAREFLSGAVALLRDNEDDTAETALELAEEALCEARRLLGHRLAGSSPVDEQDKITWPR